MTAKITSPDLTILLSRQSLDSARAYLVIKSSMSERSGTASPLLLQSFAYVISGANSRQLLNRLSFITYRLRRGLFSFALDNRLERFVLHLLSRIILYVGCLGSDNFIRINCREFLKFPPQSGENSGAAAVEPQCLPFIGSSIITPTTILSGSKPGRNR